MKFRTRRKEIVSNIWKRFLLYADNNLSRKNNYLMVINNVVEHSVEDEEYWITLGVFKMTFISVFGTYIGLVYFEKHVLQQFLPKELFRIMNSYEFYFWYISVRLM